MHLYETHLPVRDTEQSRQFYVDIVGLQFAHRDAIRDVVFLWRFPTQLKFEINARAVYLELQETIPPDGLTPKRVARATSHMIPPVNTATTGGGIFALSVNIADTSTVP